MDTDSRQAPQALEEPRWSWWYWKVDYLRAVFIYREFVPRPAAWLLCQLGRHEWFDDGRCLWCGRACRCRKAAH